MWLPTRTFDLFRISKDTVDSQREELAAIRAERDAIKADLLSTKAHFEWLCLRVNQLELERAQLITKAYGIQMTAPEVVLPSRVPPLAFDPSTLFEDVGDEKARALGMPVYGDKH